jgi:hypothetical protein
MTGNNGNKPSFCGFSRQEARKAFGTVWQGQVRN